MIEIDGSDEKTGGRSDCVGWAPPTDPTIGGRCPPYQIPKIGLHCSARVQSRWPLTSSEPSQAVPVDLEGLQDALTSGFERLSLGLRGVPDEGERIGLADDRDHGAAGRFQRLGAGAWGRLGRWGRERRRSRAPTLTRAAVEIRRASPRSARPRADPGRFVEPRRQRPGDRRRPGRRARAATGRRPATSPPGPDHAASGVPGTAQVVAATGRHRCRRA